MSYSLKEIYYTLQGEGARAGRAAVFCRFSGCNLWSGREQDKASASCWFCDTDFVGTDGVGGGKFADPERLAAEILAVWERGAKGAGGDPYVVFTGGEPLLQLDEALLRSVKAKGFETAVETNGTRAASPLIDWVTVSPKVLEKLIQRQGQELKLLYPFDIAPKDVEGLAFNNFYLSPMNVADEEQSRRNLEGAMEYCRNFPQWRLTMQYHKLWRIP